MSDRSRDPGSALHQHHGSRQPALSFLPVKWLIRNRFENLAKINRVRAPVLIYFGTRDAVIPGDQFVRLFDGASEPKRLVKIEGADHVDAWESGGAEVCMDFLMTLQHHAS